MMMRTASTTLFLFAISISLTLQDNSLTFFGTVGLSFAITRLPEVPELLQDVVEPAVYGAGGLFPYLKVHLHLIYSDRDQS